MADYLIRQSFLDAYRDSITKNSKSATADATKGAAEYDKAYTDLNSLFFPYLGATEEHREQWIKLIHAFFNETQGGFWYSTKDWKKVAPFPTNLQKDITDSTELRRSLLAYFNSVNNATNNYSQGGSGIDNVDLFKKLIPDLTNLFTDSPGIMNRIRILAMRSHDKWLSVNTGEATLDNTILSDHFNSMYNQMTGWLLDYYKGKPLYSKDGATIVKVKDLIKSGAAKTKVTKLLEQGSTSTSGTDNSQLKQNWFPIDAFLVEFENRFIFESAAYSDLKPSQVLLSLVEKPGVTASPTPSNVLSTQSAQAPPAGSTEPTVKNTDLNAESLVEQPASTESPEVAAQTQSNQPTPPPLTGQVGSTPPQSNQTQNTQIVNNQSAVQNTTINNSVQPPTSTEMLSTVASTEIMSDEAARSQLYISLQGANWKESLKLRTQLLKLDQDKQSQMAQAFVKDPGSLPNIISVLNGERRKLQTEVEEKKTKTKEERLEKSKRILEEAELKKKELSSNIGNPSDVVAQNPNPVEKLEIPDSEVEQPESKTEAKQPAVELVKTESKNLIKEDQAKSIINPPNQTKEAVERLGSTIIQSSANTATEINKAVSNIKSAESNTVNNSSSSQTITSTSVNQGPNQAESPKTESIAPTQDMNAGSGLAEYYLHAIYDALVGQGIKIRG